jgi:MFS family permease
MNKKLDEYGGISRRGLKTFDSLKIPVFRLYFGTMTGHWFSMNMQMVARSLLIYRLTNSGAILGAMALANSIPVLTLSLYGGAIADRVQKKYVLLVSQVGSAVITLIIALTLTTGYLSSENPGSWWLLIASAVLQGTIMGFMMPSRQAIIPEIVGEEKLMNAISLNNLGMNTFQIMAPALAGFLIDAYDFDVIYYTMTSVYLMATIGTIFLPSTRTMVIQGSSTLADVLDGLRYIRRETTILLILVFTLCCTIFGMPHRLLMPMFTEDILNVGATGLGVLMGISGIGALLGSLVLASLPNRKRGIMLLVSGLIMGIALMSFSFSQWWYLSLALMFFVGLGQTGQMALGNALIQYHSDANYRGRVMSFLMMGFGLASLGTFFGGILAEAVGIQWSIGGLAMALVLISIMMSLFSTRLRKME